MNYITEILMAVALWLLAIWMLNKWYDKPDVTFIMSLPAVILVVAILGPLGVWISSSVVVAVGLQQLNKSIQGKSINLDSSPSGRFNNKVLNTFNTINTKLSEFQRWAFNLGK